MKPFLFLAAIGACLVSARAADSAGEAALAFLDGVRAQSIRLEHDTDTAISPHTSSAKVLEIASHLKRSVHDLGDKPLLLGEVKTDGHLAAAMVWKADGYDPSQMQVFPVALVHRGDRWLPGPVPASFDNCGVSYEPATRQRADALEQWMLEQRVKDLAILRRDCIKRMREQIESHITQADLKKLDARAALQRFLSACQSRNEHEILGMLGGLSSPLPDNWAQRAMSIELATAQTDPLIPWRLLMNDSILSTTVEFDEDRYGAMATIACLDAAIAPLFDDGEPRIQLLSLKLSKAPAGIWQIDPPDFIWQAGDQPAGVADEKLDRDILAPFTALIRKQIPAQPASSLEQAEAALIHSLQFGKLHDLLALTELSPDSPKDLSDLLAAARLWASLHGLPSTRRPASAHQLLPLARHVIDQRAAILCQRFSARRPDRFDPVMLHLQSDGHGWRWQPDAPDTKAFDDWRNTQQKQWQIHWQQAMVAGCEVMAQAPQAAAPTEDESRELLNNWFQALQSGDVAKALTCCARLNLEDSPVMLLRNLGYEIVSALRNKQVPKLENILDQGIWSAASTCLGANDDAAYPLYPIIATPSGPRILLEIDLIAAGGRGREFLNRTSLTRLRQFNQQAGDELHALFERHQQLSTAPKAE